MIEARVDFATDEIKVGFSGALADLCAELGYIVGYVYCRIKEKAEKSAAVMRALMAELMCDDSPIWEPEDDSEGAEDPWECTGANEDPGGSHASVRTGSE